MEQTKRNDWIKAVTECYVIVEGKGKAKGKGKGKRE